MPNDRPKVGPADPETRRRKLRETLDSEAASRKAERTSEAAERNSARVAKKKAKGKTSTLKQLLDPKAGRDRTARGENTSLMEAVEEGVRQGSDKKRK